MTIFVAGASRGLGLAITRNAGVLLGRRDSATDIRKAELMDSLEIHAVGPALVVKHLLPLLDPGAGVQILNVSSESGSMSGVSRLDFAYSISRCALNMYTAMLRMLAGQVAPPSEGWFFDIDLKPMSL